MNQPQDVEASADVRPFLPQPGEAVETYAQRLRALHRDLTLVLEAVERGLEARGGAPMPPPPAAPEPPRFETRRPEPEAADVEAPEPELPEIEPPRRIMAPGPGMARVEVISTTRSDEPSYGRRASDLPPAIPETAAVPAPAAAPAPAAPAPAAPVSAPAPAPASRPVAQPPAQAPPAETRLVLPAWAPAAFLASWLTVVALLLIVLLDR